MENLDLENPMGMLSSFSLSTIIASSIFGIIGLFVFRHGKKTANISLVFTALAMMAYPLFTKGWLQDWGVGIGLCALAYHLNRTQNMTG